ncbi:MAG TPA: hypothetical protein VE263_20945 [Candidatus Angelobacter sp.]|nr:hypothetical protein [Candidatus Angelobacter sp.]
MEAQAKPFVLFKSAILGFGIGAALLLTPACKAQSEISPDHFDGTDSWAVAAQTVQAPVHKLSVAKASLPAKSERTAQNSLFQLAAAREVSKPVRLVAVAMEPKRKAAPRKPEKQ